MARELHANVRPAVRTLCWIGIGLLLASLLLPAAAATGATVGQVDNATNETDDLNDGDALAANDDAAWIDSLMDRIFLQLESIQSNETTDDSADESDDSDGGEDSGDADDADETDDADGGAGDGDAADGDNADDVADGDDAEDVDDSDGDDADVDDGTSDDADDSDADDSDADDSDADDTDADDTDADDTDADDGDAEDSDGSAADDTDGDTQETQLRLEGSADYFVEVSGDIRPADSIAQWVTEGEQYGDGQVDWWLSDSWTEWYFTGELETLEVDDPSTVSVFVDGEEVEPDTASPPADDADDSDDSDDASDGDTGDSDDGDADDSSSDLTYEQQVELAIHDEVNEIRAERGLSQLEYDDRIASVARGHSDDMAANNYFAHTTPRGETVGDRFAQGGLACQRWGENLAYNYHSSEEPEVAAARSVTQWMNSDGHRENILDARWDSQGIGVAIAADGRLYATQNLGTNC